MTCKDCKSSRKHNQSIMCITANGVQIQDQLSFNAKVKWFASLSVVQNKHVLAVIYMLSGG